MGSSLIGGSESQASDNRVGASDQARLVKGGNNQYTESGGFTLGKGGKYQDVGATDFSGAKDTNFGTQVKDNKGTVVFNDPAAALKAIDATSSLSASFADTLKGLTKQSTDALANVTQTQLQAQEQLAGSTNSMLGKLIENQQSGHDTNKTIIYIVLWALGLLAAVFLYRR